MVKDAIATYNAAQRRKRTAILVVLVVIIAVLAVFSIAQTRYPTTFQQAWQVIINHLTGVKPVTYDDVMRDQFVFNQDVPRVICAIAIGASLAVCGAVMQSITHNPLTDPYTMGLSSAALLGVNISIILGIAIIPGLPRDWTTITNAFIFTMVPAAIIIFLTTFRKLNSTMMVLSGIGIMYVFTAFSTFIKINAEPEKLDEVYRWTVGTLSMVTWDAVLPLIMVTIASCVVMTIMGKRLNILTTGDRTAQSLGVNPIWTRGFCFLIIAIVVATCVSFSGTIGFVGLVAPHITRLFTGNNNRILLPFSAIVGALLLLVADTIVRMIPYGLPAGVITALIGSPLFIYFLYRQRKTETF